MLDCRPHFRRVGEPCELKIRGSKRNSCIGHGRSPKANSGHPGAPMGMADIAEVLWNDFLKHNPQNPDWPDRDRFVLSNGHGSMLIYSLLHLSGYDLSMDDIKDFRQLHSRTPGHPVRLHARCRNHDRAPRSGAGKCCRHGGRRKVDGRPLQSGRAPHCRSPHLVLCWRWLLDEGISHEACSLAGTLGLGKLTVVYDDNGISIDGEVDGWFTDDTVKRSNPTAGR